MSELERANAETIFPQEYGDLTVVGLLGEGGSSTTYWAKDRTTQDSTYILKLLQSNLKGERRAKHVRALKNEIEIIRELASSNTPNIWKPVFLRHENGEEVYSHTDQERGELVGFAMSHSRGITLQELIDAPGSLDDYDEEKVKRIRANLPRELCQAVEPIHAGGFIHKDIKPGNMLVEPNGKIVIFDFGLAVDAERGAGAVTVVFPEQAGTPEYQSPQQKKGNRARFSDDVYSIGATLFHFYTGNETLPSHGEVEQKLLESGVPRRLRKGIASCLVEDEAHRPKDANEAAKLFESKPTLATVVDIPEPVVDPPKEEGESKEGEPVEEPPKKPSRIWFRLACLLALGMTGFLLNEAIIRIFFEKRISLSGTTMVFRKIPNSTNYVGIYEVALGEYRSFAKNHTNAFDHKDAPAVNVSYSEAEEFVKWLNETNRVPGGFEVRLPSKGDWQKLCSAAYEEGELDAAFKNGEIRCETDSPMVVNASGIESGGFNGVLGNVWEWCVDTDGVPVAMGGGFADDAEDCRPESEMRLKDEKYVNVGFRLILVPKEETESPKR